MRQVIFIVHHLEFIRHRRRREGLPGIPPRQSHIVGKGRLPAASRFGSWMKLKFRVCICPVSSVIWISTSLSPAGEGECLGDRGYLDPVARCLQAPVDEDLDFGRLVRKNSNSLTGYAARWGCREKSRERPDAAHLQEALESAGGENQIARRQPQGLPRPIVDQAKILPAELELVQGAAFPRRALALHHPADQIHGAVQIRGDRLPLLVGSRPRPAACRILWNRRESGCIGSGEGALSVDVP